VKNKKFLMIVFGIVGGIIIAASVYLVFFNTQYYKITRTGSGLYGKSVYIASILEHKPLEYMKIHVIYDHNHKFSYSNFWRKKERFMTIDLKINKVSYIKADFLSKLYFDKDINLYRLD